MPWMITIRQEATKDSDRVNVELKNEKKRNLKCSKFNEEKTHVKCIPWKTNETRQVLGGSRYIYRDYLYKTGALVAH
jgi:hypothetical protein